MPEERERIRQDTFTEQRSENDLLFGAFLFIFIFRVIFPVGPFFFTIICYFVALIARDRFTKRRSVKIFIFAAFILVTVAGIFYRTVMSFEFGLELFFFFEIFIEVFFLLALVGVDTFTKRRSMTILLIAFFLVGFVFFYSGKSYVDELGESNILFLSMMYFRMQFSYALFIGIIPVLVTCAMFRNGDGSLSGIGVPIGDTLGYSLYLWEKNKPLTDLLTRGNEFVLFPLVTLTVMGLLMGRVGVRFRLFLEGLREFDERTSIDTMLGIKWKSHIVLTSIIISSFLTSLVVYYL